MRRKNNFKDDILQEADGAPIEAIVVSSKRGELWGDLETRPVLSWEKALPMIDYEYDSGFGREDCHGIYAWTDSRVLFVHEYDGSTQVNSVPRNPTTECELEPPSESG